MAPRTTVDECNREGRAIYFDADVLIEALRHRDSAEARHLTRVKPGLRRLGPTTRFEVAFAKRGDQAATGDRVGRLRENLQALHDWGFTFEGFLPQIGQEFDHLMSSRGHLRGEVRLGDALLACTAIARGGTQRCAIATRNVVDFEGFNVPLVADFAPTRGP